MELGMNDKRNAKMPVGLRAKVSRHVHKTLEMLKISSFELTTGETNPVNRSGVHRLVQKDAETVGIGQEEQEICRIVCFFLGDCLKIARDFKTNV